MTDEATVLPEEIAPAETEETEAAPVEATPDDDGIIDLDAPEETEAVSEEAEEVDEVEMIEWDFGGNKIEVPKGSIDEETADKIGKFTKDAFADYTRKSQANAETAKQLASEREAVVKLQSLEGDAQTTYAKGLQLRTEIEQLQQVNINHIL